MHCLLQSSKVASLNRNLAYVYQSSQDMSNMQGAWMKLET
jgi:hypothetical protein